MRGEREIYLIFVVRNVGKYFIVLMKDTGKGNHFSAVSILRFKEQFNYIIKKKIFNTCSIF